VSALDEEGTGFAALGHQEGYRGLAAKTGTEKKREKVLEA
jgi:hypothetical protein